MMLSGEALVAFYSSSFAASEDGGDDEEPKVNEEEFFFAVAESTSKITIHAIRLGFVSDGLQYKSGKGAVNQ